MKLLTVRSRLTRRGFLGTVSAVLGSLVVFPRSLPRISLRAPLSLLIKGGSVLDGTGSPEQLLNVGIRDGKIMALGALEGAEADRVIDAKDHYVVPGFIDIHSHVDTSIFKDPHSESKVRQGVTTEVSGMDGDSAAPLGGPSLERQLKSFEEAFGFECPFRDLDGYFTALAKNGTAQNVVTFVGLGTVRGKIVGLDNRPATDDEMEAMKKEVLLGIEQGAYGVSTGLEYTPGSFASTRELWELVKVVPEKFRLYATHMRNEDDRLLGAIEEAITIAREGNGRLQVSHLKAQNKTNWPKQKIALEMLDSAIASGIDVHADRYPYLAFSTGLTNLFPLWSREGPTREFIKKLNDPETLAKIRVEVEKKVSGLGSWDAVMISSVHNDENKHYQGRTVQQIVGTSDPFAFVVDLLIQEDARVGMVGFGMNEEGTEMVLAWPRTSVASDGGAYSPKRPTSTPHPRCYGTFPRAIAHYQRERHITTLPDMIRKMTSLPASTLGLPDRGILAAGHAADVVIFNYATIKDNATFVNPHQFPDGIPYVIVNGTVVVDGNNQTDALPGEVVRSSSQ